MAYPIKPLPSAPATLWMALLLCSVPCSLPSAPAMITVDVSRPGHAVSPALYGIFFEDINCSADGGLYAELVRNRNFEDSSKPDYWSTVSSGQGAVELAIDSAGPPSPKNLHSLKVQITNPGSGRAGVANSGFWGISLKTDQTYELSFLARGDDGFAGPLQAALESADG